MICRPIIQAGAQAALVLTACAALAEPVVEIEVRNAGHGQVDTNFVLAHTRVAPGRELNRAEVSRDIRALLDTGRFSEAQADVRRGENGLVLTYTVRNKLKLEQPVTVLGADRLGPARVRTLLGLEPGDLVDDQTIAARSRPVRDEYEKMGFGRVELSWAILLTNRDAGLATVEVSVVEGSRVFLSGVVFTGNNSIAGRILLKAMQQPAPWNIFMALKRREFDRDAIAEGVDAIREIYRAKGYLRVRIAEPETTQTRPGRMAVCIRIEEGPLCRIGNVAIRGGRLFPEPELRKACRTDKGTLASTMAIRQAAEAISDYYGERGYMNTFVEPVLEAGATPDSFDVQFLIEEGRPAYIRNVEVRGNTRTRDKVIRRELLIHPGDKFDQKKIKVSERRLMNLGYFSFARGITEPAPDPEQTDIAFEVEEKPFTGRVMFGAGFSTIDRVMGFGELSHGNFDILGWPNFTGGGQKLKLSAQLGSRRKDYSFSFVEPWFLDRKLSLGLDLFSQDRNYQDYDVERVGGSVGLGLGLKPIDNFTRLDVRYGIERSRISSVADTNAYLDAGGNDFFFPQGERFSESTFRLSISRDTRDSVFAATRGTKVALSGSITGGPLGLDTDMYGLGLDARQYVPLWFRHVLSLRARAEVVDGFGDTDEIPLFERLFVGGPTTIRGYDWRDVGPKVTRTLLGADGTSAVVHRPSGARTTAMGTVEYNIPVVSPIRLVCFFDIGNGWEDAYDMEFSSLASSAGVGIRFDIPEFPIRIDYGWPVEKDDDLTDLRPWSFWIGYEY